MRSELECLTCLIRQGINTARFACDNPEQHRRIVNRIAKELIPEADLSLSPADISNDVYRIVREETGIKDPYATLKKETNAEAMQLLPDLQKLVKQSEDPVNAAVHLAVSGNMIDLGIGHTFDIKKDIYRMLKIPFAIDDIRDFKNDLKPGKKLLYLGDNSGEIVFDRILVEVLLGTGVDMTFVVKSTPIINDATMEDARYAGLTDLVPVIETGSGDIGVHFGRASQDFLNAFDSADLIVAKGHGNFETCDGKPQNLYFLVKAKCDIVAAALGVKLGDIVFYHQNNQ